MSKTRFIWPGKSKHRDYGGDPRHRKRSANPDQAPTLNTGDPKVMKRAIDMTDDELAAIASGATLHVVK
jgi:hypothetical protein